MPYVLREAADPARGRLHKAERNPSAVPRPSPRAESETSYAGTGHRECSHRHCSRPARLCGLQEAAAQDQARRSLDKAFRQLWKALRMFLLEDTDATPSSPAPPAQSRQSWANLSEVPTEESFAQVQHINEEEL